jgi:hypothetical protein
MKVSTNIRAGQGQKQKQGSSTDSTSVSSPDPVVVYYPPVTRCPGI